MDLLEEIQLGGEVPHGSQVKLSIKIDATSSKKQRHIFSYQMVYGPKVQTHCIGQPIKLQFRLATQEQSSGMD